MEDKEIAVCNMKNTHANLNTKKNFVHTCTYFGIYRYFFKYILICPIYHSLYYRHPHEVLDM